MRIVPETAILIPRNFPALTTNVVRFPADVDRDPIPLVDMDTAEPGQPPRVMRAQFFVPDADEIAAMRRGAPVMVVIDPSAAVVVGVRVMTGDVWGRL